MEPAERALTLEERLTAQEDLSRILLGRGKRGLVIASFAVAVAIHLVAAIVRLPSARLPAGPVARPRVASLSRADATVPAPLRVDLGKWRAMPVPKPAASAAALPMPYPEPLEPVAEGDRELEGEMLPPDAQIVLGVPEPPPPGPEPEAAGDFIPPEILPQTKVQPVYPERAKRLQASGSVVLRLDVGTDGTVGNVTVLRCNPPNLGFCEAAVKVVKNWRYTPARHGRTPVAASVMVRFDFTAPR